MTSEEQKLADIERKIRQKHAYKHLSNEMQYRRYVLFAEWKIRNYGLQHRNGSLNTDGNAYVREAYLAYINGRNLPPKNEHIDIDKQDEDQWKRYMYDAIGSKIKDDNRKVSQLSNHEVSMPEELEDRKSSHWDQDPQRHMESFENMSRLLGDPGSLQERFLLLFINNKEYTNEWAAEQLSVSVGKVKQLKKDMKDKVQRVLNEYLDTLEKPNFKPVSKPRQSTGYISE